MSDEIETNNSGVQVSHDLEIQDEDVALSRYAEAQYYDLYSPVSFAPFNPGSAPSSDVPDTPDVVNSVSEAVDFNNSGSALDEASHALAATAAVLSGGSAAAVSAALASIGANYASTFS